MRARILRAVRSVNALVLVTVLLTLILPVGAASQQAYSYDGPLENVVIDWNLNASNALINAPANATPGMGQATPVSPIHLAMVHGAIYDAVNMIDGGYQPYLKGLPAAPRSASKAAAVATAAHDTLVGIAAVVPTNQTLTPAIVAGIVTRLDGLRDATLAAATAADGPASVAAGVAAGKAAAAAMLAERANDGRYGPFRFPAGTKPGEWRPTSVDANGVPITDANAWVAKVKPFTLTSAAQVRTKGPNALTSEAYTKDYNEVKALGGATSARNPEQQAVADFYNNQITPIEVFNRTFRTIAADRKLTLVEQARLFAMLNLATADALIGCWEDKAYWNFWRPVTAIREGDNDGNPNTVGDPNWTSLVPATPYPDHPSAFNAAVAPFMYAAIAFFGTDQMEFDVVRIVAGTPNVTRHYSSFTAVTRDVIEARVYQGLHFRTADIQGAGLGQQAAEWMAANYFRPVAPAPPPTGNGGNLPGMPSTGAGGGMQPASLGWLVLAVSVGAIAGGWYLRRRRRQA